MKVSALAVLASATFASVATADHMIELTYQALPGDDNGKCIDLDGTLFYTIFDLVSQSDGTISPSEQVQLDALEPNTQFDYWYLADQFYTPQACFDACENFATGLIAMSVGKDMNTPGTINSQFCSCHYNDGTHPDCAVVQGLFPNAECHYQWTGTESTTAVNDISSTSDEFYQCFKIVRDGESHGDPHFRTWQNEHFEFHGQCDVLMAKVTDFAEQPGLDLEIQIRTKMVRFWSYIKNAVIRIGDDVLEIQGSASEDIDTEIHYWYNYEYQGEMTEFAGFPVTMSSEGTKANKNTVEIDLGSKYPGQKIILKTFKEFVGVKVYGATEESFGSAVGIMGDFKSGKTVARDGYTVIDDFNKLGQEWQVLPTDGKLFREMSHPHFPEKCLIPEDPQGQRIRRLGEANVSEEAAEAACAGLKDEFDRKGCVYDILATQDLDMVGAY